MSSLGWKHWAGLRLTEFKKELHLFRRELLSFRGAVSRRETKGKCKMNELKGFGAREYFASHNPRQRYRVRKRRRMTPWHRAVFEEAMDLLRRGVPLETLERMIRKGVAK